MKTGPEVASHLLIARVNSKAEQGSLGCGRGNRLCESGEEKISCKKDFCIICAAESKTTCVLSEKSV